MGFLIQHLQRFDMNDPIREAFERITAPAFCKTIARTPDGEYFDSGLEDHWQTFQEGWEAATESAVKVLDALDKVNGVEYCTECGDQLMASFPKTCFSCNQKRNVELFGDADADLAINNYLKKQFETLIREDDRCTKDGWVPEEVIEEVKKYMKNNPTGDILSHIESAFHATAHE